MVVFMNFSPINLVHLNFQTWSSLIRQHDNIRSMPSTLLPHMRLTLPTQSITTELIRTNTATIRTDHLAASTLALDPIALRAL